MLTFIIILRRLSQTKFKKKKLITNNLTIKSREYILLNKFVLAGAIPSSEWKWVQWQNLHLTGDMSYAI